MEFNRTFDKMIDNIVNEKGLFNFGTYHDYIKHINLLDAQNPLGEHIPNSFNNSRLKEWEAFQAGNDQYFIFGAIYNTKVIGINLITIFDRRQNKVYEYKKICGPKKQVIASDLRHSQTYFKDDNFHIQITNNLENRLIHIHAHITDKDLPTLDLSLKAYHSQEALSICHPFDTNRGLYSHKALMHMEGHLTLDETNTPFHKHNSFTIIDDHKGYYPYKLKYDWLTGYCFDNQQQLIGFNLTHNQIQNPDKNNENCLWYQGETYLLSSVIFKRYEGKEPYWHIQDQYDMVNVFFYPIEKVSMNFDLLIIGCKYEAPFGTFKGYIRTGPNSEKISVNQCFGMGEDKEYKL